MTDAFNESVSKFRKTFEITPNTPFIQKEFGFYSLDKWYENGLDRNSDLNSLFGFDFNPEHTIRGIGWTAANLFPPYEEIILEDKGEYEVLQDVFGRKVLYFKGRRTGFMPTYIEHPVKDIYSFEKNIKWRLDFDNIDRKALVNNLSMEAEKAMDNNYFITQRLIGGYMFLRALIGPEDLLYKFYDDPDLINYCMETWFEIADKTIAKYQQTVTLDQLFISEDICYNGGPLISPQMIEEFLFPYYKQLLKNIKDRQINKNKPFYFQVDTDGNCEPVIDLYRSIGMNAMSPFEVASGSDVVKIGFLYPDLVMSGGIDKRILAAGKEEIDKMVDNIFPKMFKRGGYIPTCDHGVPAEVSLENYLHYRKRCLEYN